MAAALRQSYSLVAELFPRQNFEIQDDELEVTVTLPDETED
jgi:hypothetical protein